MHKMTLRTLPALILLAFSGAASAGAFQLWEQSATGLGTAYAGSAAVAEDASVNYYNPAGLTQLPGIRLSVGVAGVGPSYEFHNNGSSGTGALAGLAGSDGGNAGGWSAVPNVHLSWGITPDLAVGFSVTVPFGLETEYEDSNWIGRFQAIKSKIRTVNYNPSVAYKVSDRVSVGFGLNYQTIDGDLTSTGAVLKGDDASWGWNAGALFTLSPAMRVGVSYRSGIKHTLEGTVNGAVPLRADLDLPDTFVLSVWQQVSDRWEAMGDLSYTRWNSLQIFNVYNANTGGLLATENFNFGNSWRVAWGTAYKANDSTKLKFGIAYDHSPVHDGDRVAGIPDNDRLWLTLGAQWNGGKFGKVDVGYAYLYVKDPGIEQTRTLAPGTTSTLRGSYDASANIVGVQYSVGF